MASHTQSPRRRRNLPAAVLLTALACVPSAFVTSFSITPLNNSPRAPQLLSAKTISSRHANSSLLATNNKNNKPDLHIDKPLVTALLSISLLLTPFLPPTVNAYEETDYASETVTNVVSALKQNAGDVDGTFATLEEVAKIITEGKGVGGSLSYDGVKLNQGYVADEDTTIYNPGLTLLTSSEKERLVSAIIENRKIGLSTNRWSENNEYAFDFLKQKLDPLHMYELEGYLGILPFYGAAVYLVGLWAQQNARGVFPLVYGACALAVFGPVIVLMANGP